MESGEKPLKAEQSAMEFGGLLLAKDSLHLKLPRIQMCTHNHPLTTYFYYGHALLSSCWKCAQNIAVFPLPNLRLYQFKIGALFP